jgi:hypothetical protein
MRSMPGRDASWRMTLARAVTAKPLITHNSRIVARPGSAGRRGADLRRGGFLPERLDQPGIALAAVGRFVHAGIDAVGQGDDHRDLVLRRRVPPVQPPAPADLARPARRRLTSTRAPAECRLAVQSSVSRRA